MARRRPLVPVLLLALVSAASCRRACGGGRGAIATVEGQLAMFPVETRVLVSLDLAALRGSPAIAKLNALAQQTPSDKKELDEFTARTGLDPLHHIDSLILGFPKEGRQSGEMGLVLRASHLDEARLIAYVRDSLKNRGDDLVATPHGRRTLWSIGHDPSLAGFFADDHTFVLGAGGWAARMADLADSAQAKDSAATDIDLVALAARAGDHHAIWAAALVPEETRRVLRADPRFASAAAVMTLAAGFDLGKDLQAVLLADVGTTADAQALARKVQDSLRDAKRNAQILMLGLGPYLDGVSAHASDHSFQLRASLTELQVDDLIARLGAYLSLLRAGRPPGF